MSRNSKASYMKNRQKEIEQLEDVKDFLVFVVLRDNFPFWCDMEPSDSIEQVARLNKDAGYERYKVKKASLKIHD